MSTSPGTMGLGLWGFLALMMAAMTLPVLAPLTSIYLRSIRAVRSSRIDDCSGRRLTSDVDRLRRRCIRGRGAVGAAGCGRARSRTLGGRGTAGGGRGLPGDACLRHCRSPMAFLLHVGTFDNQAVNGSMGNFTCREKAEQFIARDRFVLEGLAVPGSIREWNVCDFLRAGCLLISRVHVPRALHFPGTRESFVSNNCDEVPAVSSRRCVWSGGSRRRKLPVQGGSRRTNTTAPHMTWAEPLRCSAGAYPWEFGLRGRPGAASLRGMTG